MVGLKGVFHALKKARTANISLSNFFSYFALLVHHNATLPNCHYTEGRKWLSTGRKFNVLVACYRFLKVNEKSLLFRLVRNFYSIAF